MDAVTYDQSRSGRLSSPLRRRAWPLGLTVAFVVVGMAYTLFWAPVVQHNSIWIYPGDIWATYRSAHFVGWGDIGGIYSAGTGLVTFPGILLLLAPVAMLTGALGMSEAFPKYMPHPSSWLVLGPYEMIVSAIVLFACDAIAERLGLSRARRAVLCLVEVSVLWNVAVLWGHPEDAVAVGLALYALLLAVDGRWVGAGWLFGVAMATQPLVLLMLPVLLALGGRRQIVGVVTRSIVPAAVLLVAPLISQFRATTHALFDQPNYPGVDHVTPWTALAPVIGGTGRGLTVAAGPGRIVALALACGLGWWARRWRHDPVLILWAAAAALALRCLTESVMVGFYVWPTLAIGLVVSARLGRWHLAAAGAAAVLTTAVAQWRLSWLPWWVTVTTGIVIVLILGTRIGLRSTSKSSSDLSVASRGREPPAVLVGVT